MGSDDLGIGIGIGIAIVLVVEIGVLFIYIIWRKLLSKKHQGAKTKYVENEQKDENSLEVRVFSAKYIESNGKTYCANAPDIQYLEETKKGTDMLASATEDISKSKFVLNPKVAAINHLQIPIDVPRSSMEHTIMGDLGTPHHHLKPDDVPRSSMEHSIMGDIGAGTL